MNKGFSLVELSIVLVILGLLIGGVLTGQNLIRAAELRSIPVQFDSYRTAVNLFRDKYFGLPGDISNATSFWGDNASQCADAAIANGSPGTCNGNNNGQLTFPATVNTTGEAFAFWQQLSLAGLIEGKYSGLSGPTQINEHTPGDNAPISKLGGDVGYSAFYLGTVASGSFRFAGDYGSVMTVGNCTVFYCNQAALTPEDAWNIDTKMDDGKPGTGVLVTRPDDGAASGGQDDCVVGDSTQSATATYELTYKSAACGFYLRKVF